MEEYTDNQQISNFENPQPQRPTGLTVWCVLSFINAGFQFTGDIFYFLFYKIMKEFVQSEDYLEMMEGFVPDIDEFEEQMALLFSINRVNYLLQALLFAGSFVGVLFMWKQLKKGFHIYAISQILILIVTAIFVTSVTGASIWGNVILTAIWIGIYYMYYRRFEQ